jgi:hypothetical protein
MNGEPLAREREPIERGRARLEALVMANAAPRCGARSKRTGKPCRGAAMPNGRCKLHGGKSTGPRTPEGLERSRRANWSKLETRALFAGGEGGTVAPAGGNTCAQRPVRLDARIHIDTVAALRDPAVKANFDNIGMVAVGSTPEELAAMLTAETEKWQPVVKQAHIALD